MRITKELRGDIDNISANLDCFSDARLGKFFRDVLERELEKAKKKQKKVFSFGEDASWMHN